MDDRRCYMDGQVGTHTLTSLDGSKQYVLCREHSARARGSAFQKWKLAAIQYVESADD